VNDQSIAFKSFQAGYHAFDWNIDAPDLPAAKSMAGFTSKSLLQTAVLYFNNRMPPFDNVAVRQAFAYATDKTTLVNTILKMRRSLLRRLFRQGCPVIKQITRDCHLTKARRWLPCKLLIQM